MSALPITLGALGKPPQSQGRPSQYRVTGRMSVRQVSGRERFREHGVLGGAGTSIPGGRRAGICGPGAADVFGVAEFKNEDDANSFGRTLHLPGIVIRVTARAAPVRNADRKCAASRSAAHRLAGTGGLDRWSGPVVWTGDRVVGQGRPPVRRCSGPGAVPGAPRVDSADLESRAADTGEPHGRGLTGQSAPGGTFT